MAKKLHANLLRFMHVCWHSNTKVVNTSQWSHIKKKCTCAQRDEILFKIIQKNQGFSTGKFYSTKKSHLLSQMALENKFCILFSVPDMLSNICHDGFALYFRPNPKKATKAWSLECNFHKHFGYLNLLFFTYEGLHSCSFKGMECMHACAFPLRAACKSKSVELNNIFPLKKFLKGGLQPQKKLFAEKGTWIVHLQRIRKSTCNSAQWYV